MDNYLGEIRLFSFPRVPDGWMPCNGQPLPINQYQALYSLLGLQFGGNGTTTFNLPDLRGRVPVNFGPPAYSPTTPIPMGSANGSDSVTLTLAQLPAHNHAVSAYNTNGNTGALLSAFPAQCVAPSVTPAPPAAPSIYGQPAQPSNVTTLAAVSVNSCGTLTPPQIQPHENRQPTIALNYCICVMDAIYPPRT